MSVNRLSKYNKIIDESVSYVDTVNKAIKKFYKTKN